MAPAAPGGGTPAGNVVVTVSGGTETYTGTVAAGQCTLTLNGTGPRTITATYAGDTNFTGGSDTESHNVDVSISGNIQRNNDPSASSSLAGVQVDLTGSSTQTTFTDAGGSYSFTVNLAAGGTYTVTPSGQGFTYNPESRTYASLTTNVTNANFIGFQPGQSQRGLRVETTFVDSPNQVQVPITLTSLGDERQVNFSLGYNPAILSAPLVTCGSAATGCTIVQTAGAAGQTGIQVTLASPPALGGQQLVRVMFNTAAGTNSNTPVLFTNTPTARRTIDVAGNPLATGYSGGLVVFTAQGLEGDLQTRFTGDGLYRANDVEQQRRFVSLIDIPNGTTNEFERADAAPYNSKGDGRLTAADLQIIINYVSNLVAGQTAGGPDLQSRPHLSRSVMRRRTNRRAAQCALCQAKPHPEAACRSPSSLTRSATRQPRCLRSAF